MNAIDLTLNAVIAITVTVFLAYLGYSVWDFGIFTTLPAEVAGFFLDNAALQYVALGVLVAAMTAKLPVGRAMLVRVAVRVQALESAPPPLQAVRAWQAPGHPLRQGLADRLAVVEGSVGLRQLVVHRPMMRVEPNQPVAASAAGATVVAGQNQPTPRVRYHARGVVATG